MKISFSLSSSPSTSSTSISSDTDLSNSQNVTAKCFSSIIRRFLGVGSFRTHPFDCNKEPNQVQHDDEFTLHDEKTQAAPSTPGLVARLMGLETMPELELMKNEKTKNPESIGRSRSTNSVDFSAKVDQKHRQHQRVKSSSSFLEMPELFELENDEFLLLTFENVGEEHKERVKCDFNKNERLQRGIKIRNDLGLVHPLKEISDSGSKLTKAKNRKSSLQKNVEVLPELENWSPNSVLNLDEFQLDNDSSLSEEELKERNSNSRRKLSTDIASSDYTSQHFTHVPVADILESRTNSVQGSIKITKSEFSANGNCKEMWRHVCKLTEDDMKTTTWLGKQVQRMEGLEEIGAEFGQEIFDRLLQEIVIEVGELTDFALS
ncbi:hypothetical protein MKX01_016440 [Papaver californicum]|nr:hypothetical protein MKX01_016440 [Papaver californicum]